MHQVVSASFVVVLLLSACQINPARYELEARRNAAAAMPSGAASAVIQDAAPGEKVPPAATVGTASPPPASSRAGCVWVAPHVRRNGAHVSGHWRCG